MITVQHYNIYNTIQYNIYNTTLQFDLQYNIVNQLYFSKIIFLKTQHLPESVTTTIIHVLNIYSAPDKMLSALGIYSNLILSTTPQQIGIIIPI